MKRLPIELEQAVVAAGYACLADWLNAANVAPSTIYGARWTGRALSRRTLQRLLVVSRSPLAAAQLGELLLRKHEVAS